jgi:uncharacterized protein YkwD
VLAELVRAVNAARATARTCGSTRYAAVPPVVAHPTLTAVAEAYAVRLGRDRFFDHTSPVPGKRTPSDRAARFGTSGGAENIASGHDTGASAIRGWWYSPGHHRNMLGDHARTGLGRSGSLWTQMFGG